MLLCTALMAKITVEANTMRINMTVSACCFCAEPGAMRARTNHGAP